MDVLKPPPPLSAVLFRSSVSSHPVWVPMGPVQLEPGG